MAKEHLGKLDVDSHALQRFKERSNHPQVQDGVKNKQLKKTINGLIRRGQSVAVRERQGR